MWNRIKECALYHGSILELYISLTDDITVRIQVEEYLKSHSRKDDPTDAEMEFAEAMKADLDEYQAAQKNRS